MELDCVHIKNCSICCCEEKPPLFQVLTDEEYEKLFKNRKEIVYSPQENIFKQGTPLTHIACIRRGYAKIYVERPSGRNLIVKILKPAELAGGMGILVDYTHHFTVTAMTEVHCCLIKVEDFVTALENSRQFSLELIKRNNMQGIHTNRFMANLTHKTMYGRVADAILYMNKEIFDGNDADVIFSRQDYADLSAMSKESFIRIIKELKESNLIETDGNRIKILNEEALIKLSVVQ